MCTLVATLASLLVNHRKVEPVSERGNCLFLRAIAISLLLAVALYSLILVTWPLFSKSFATLVHYFLELVHYVLEPGHSLILLSTMSWKPFLFTLNCNLATFVNYALAVTWPLLFTMPCYLASLAHYALALGLSCPQCPGTWPLLSTMSWNLATLGRSCPLFPGTWPLLAALVHYFLELGHSWPFWPWTWPLLAVSFSQNSSHS